MAAQMITLQTVTSNPDGSIEVVIEWDGSPFSKTFADEAALRAANESPISSLDEAHRWLMWYLLPLSADVAALASKAGKSLTIEVEPAVSQTITLS